MFKPLCMVSVFCKFNLCPEHFENFSNSLIASSTEDISFNFTITYCNTLNMCIFTNMYCNYFAINMNKMADIGHTCLIPHVNLK